MAACLLAERAHLCHCTSQYSTFRCEGCTRLPNSLPNGVSCLIISGNHITCLRSVTNVSPHLAALSAVYLSNNCIEYLGSGYLAPLKNMMVLDLSYNKLKSVDERSIASNGKLIRLILDGNQHLELVPLHSKSLKYLYLRNCGLTSFDKRLLRNLPNLGDLHLDGNDLPCENIVKDLKQDYPRLFVSCDGKTPAAENVSAITIANNAIATTIVPPKIQLAVSVPLVPIVTLAVLVGILVVLAAAIFHRFCQARPGRSGHGRLQDQEEPC